MTRTGALTGKNAGTGFRLALVTVQPETPEHDMVRYIVDPFRDVDFGDFAATGVIGNWAGNRNGEGIRYERAAREFSEGAMAVEAFGIEKEFLPSPLDEAADGKAQLPEFQRGWVWPLENIRSLLASVSLGYPVGTVMMLRTGGEVRFKQRPIEGVTAAGNAERLILDGQQRLTSLFQALKLGQPIETQDARKRRVSVSHAANPAFMLKDDFDGFIADRRRRLLRMISDAMGKRADETLGESVIEPAEADEDLHDA